MQQNDQTIDLMEKGVIASIIDDSEILGVVTEMLEPEDFYDPKHQVIYGKIIEFYMSGRVVDALSIIESIIDSGHINLGITPEYFIDLFEQTAISSNQDPIHYADRIKENSLKRRLNNEGQEIASLAHPGTGFSSEDIVAKMQGYVRAYLDSSYGDTYVSARDYGDTILMELEDRFNNGDATTHFIPTGFYDLDDRLGGGFAPGQMIIIAGRPGMGKTTLALDIGRNAALLADKTVMFFSLEMGRTELMHKMLAAEAHVKLKKIRQAKDLDRQDWEQMNSAMARLRSSNFLIDDNPELNMVNLKAKCLKQKSRPEGLDLVIIDYLQLAKMNSSHGKNREQEISEFSRDLKLLSKELDCPIVVLAQLNRGNVNRTEKRPMASDLRESGSLEQDADAVILVHRPSEYDPNEKPGVTEAILGKVRAGEQGVVDMVSLLEYSKFANAQGKFVSNEEVPSIGDEEPPPPEFDGGIVNSDEDSIPQPQFPASENSLPPLGQEPMGADPNTGAEAW